MAYIYMIRCEDQSIYTGITKDLARRMQEHYYKKKSGAKYTHLRRPLAIEALWETESWSDAAKLEYRIKRLSKEKKEALVRDAGLLKVYFADILETDKYVYSHGLTLEDCLGEGIR